MADWDPLVNEIFEQAIEAGSPAKRAAVLDRSCRGDAELRRKVEALLRAHDQAGSFLDRPASGLTEARPGASGAALAVSGEEAADPAPAPPDGTATAAWTAEPTEEFDSGPPPAPDGPDPHPIDEVVDTVIAGRYTLREKIGEGGMGEVWVARQTEPVQRMVALKLIKAGMDSRAVIRRFEQERQALALMDHPNIARVLDGGLAPTGQPFFVMELVNGLPLTKFCDEARLTPNERLELFVPICQAVQHAHQKRSEERRVGKECLE